MMILERFTFIRRFYCPSLLPFLIILVFCSVAFSQDEPSLPSPRDGRRMLNDLRRWGFSLTDVMLDDVHETEHLFKAISEIRQQTGGLEVNADEVLKQLSSLWKMVRTWKHKNYLLSMESLENKQLRHRQEALTRKSDFVPFDFEGEYFRIMKKEHEDWINKKRRFFWNKEFKEKFYLTDIYKSLVDRKFLDEVVPFEENARIENNFTTKRSDIIHLLSSIRRPQDSATYSHLGKYTSHDTLYYGTKGMRSEEHV